MRFTLLAALLALGCGDKKAEAPKKRPPPLVQAAAPQVRDVPITLAMKPRRTLQEVWPSLGGPRSGAGVGAARR